MHVDGVAAADFEADLANRFEERLALDIADSAADLDNDDVGVEGDLADPGLDLVGDVGDDLDGAAQVLTAAFLVDDRLVDLAGGEVVVAGHRAGGEALVVAEVEIGLGAVIGDVDLTVLVGAHGARVNVDVGVELLELDPVAATLEEAADGCRREPFSERRHHPAGDEDVLDRHGFGSTLRALWPLRNRGWDFHLFSRCFILARSRRSTAATS